MKYVLTFGSMLIIYQDTMVNGDPKSLFSNLFVFYAMYLLSYHESIKKYTNKFLPVTKVFLYTIIFISFAGVIGLFTIGEIEGQFFIFMSKDMRLGNYAIINVHIFFLLLTFSIIAISAVEWVIKSFAESEADTEAKGDRKKGA